MLSKTSRLPQVFVLTALVSTIFVLFIYPHASDHVKSFFIPAQSAFDPPPPLRVTHPGSSTNLTTSPLLAERGSPKDPPSPGHVTKPGSPHAHVSRVPTKSPAQTVTTANATSTLSQSQHEPRVLCWIPSIEKWIPDRIKAINETWIPRCDGHVFFIKTAQKDKYGDVIPLDVKDGRDHLPAKSMAALKHLYQHSKDFFDKFDWFLKGDDDTFIVMENLRLLLSQYNASHPVYLGRLFKKHLKRGYMSGGASYVLSREALRRLNEDGFDKNACKAHSTDEDVEIGRCLEKVGVYPHNTRDTLGRSAFHPDGPRRHMGKEAPPSASDNEYERFPAWTGRNCCSELSISFHHMHPEEIRTVNHLLYQTTVYGRVPDFDKLRNYFQAKEVPPP